jgi:diguanylate cyclase (GGDEF)-like protein
VNLAGALSDACRVELLLDPDGQASTVPRMIAVWPETSLAMTTAQVEALGYPLCLGLWCGDHYQMTLQLYARPGRGGRWPRRVVRKLTTLCAMAAAAERGMHASRRARPEAPVEQSAAVRDATFLNAILPYALSQAQRHREPLTVFCVEIDRLGALYQSHGSDVADLTVLRVAESIARTLRGSDVVARLDDDRMVVVLPNTGSADALTVAAMVRSAVVGACGSSGEVPELSASMGVACFPENAPEMIILLAAADEAVARAREKGMNQVAMYSPPPGMVAPKAS